MTITYVISIPEDEYSIAIPVEVVIGADNYVRLHQNGKAVVMSAHEAREVGKAILEGLDLVAASVIG